MFLKIYGNEMDWTTLVNMDEVKKLKATEETYVFSEPGQAEIRMDFGYIKAEWKNGKEEKLAIYTGIEDAEEELDNIAEALKTGVNIYTLTEDNKAFQKMDKLEELEAAATKAED